MMEGSQHLSNVIAERQIPYRPRLTVLTERVTASILLQQMLYYWEISKQRPFYKFRSSCKHDRYVEGDSWLECLGFSPAEFDTAIKTIGTKITKGSSRSEALEGKEVCNIVLYWTDSNRMTWYELNTSLLNELLGSLYSEANSGKRNYPEAQESTSSIESENPELHSSEIPEITHNNAASPPQPSLKEKDRNIEIYYRDKPLVRTLGTVNKGPWEVICPACEGEVHIYEKDIAVECLCKIHKFTLLSKKPHAPTKKRRPEAVEAYYAIVKSRGVRHGANEEFETDIVAAVTDLTRWRQVVKEYIHPGFGGNPYGVDKMLVYYNEARLPGTRKKKEDEAIAPTFTELEPDDFSNEPMAVGGQLDMQAIKREALEKMRKEKEARDAILTKD